MPSRSPPAPPSNPFSEPSEASALYVQTSPAAWLEGREVMRVEDGDLVRDPLREAVHFSLFTWRRARPDDPVPDGASRQGWWADAEFGSRLWLLNRLPLTTATLARAKDFAEEALAWLVTEGLARSIGVTVERRGQGQLAILVEIERPRSPRDVVRYEEIWGSSPP